MKFSTTLILAALSAVTLASPQRGGTRPTPTRTASSTPSASTSTASSPAVSCLTNTTASNMVNGFASLLTAYNNDTANALLASNFTDTSDSINFLVGKTPGTVTFPSKAAFEAGQGTQPPIGFTVLSIDAFTCNVIAFRWAATLGTQAPLKGINVLYTSNLNGTDAGWQIETVYSEFNSGLWSQEVGGICT